ncbi:TetR family transcriptional regulator [Nakamurella sp. YIM 132087]|uniref:TetR family transcriptional regulator n=1 Tax=Nakamurella alba TaxID=2665158 RepID=A0A7K1FGY9_9ACTN|nr:TetR/AcrR family transcriptional regulator [Nakamurella alba]MTD13336.1 TetR family transcriptional regulator [Nakamurella alba]
MPRPKLHDADLRARLLDRTAQTVADHGIGALSLRTLAAAEGTSTTAVYSLFGGKPGLLAALHGRAFALFSEAQHRIQRDEDPIQTLISMGLTYGEWALANPHLYQVMFGSGLAQYVQDPDQMAMSGGTFDALLDLVGEAEARGALVGDTRLIAFALWSTIHGSVSLIIAGFGPQESDAVRKTIQGVVRTTIRCYQPNPAPLRPNAPHPGVPHPSQTHHPRNHTEQGRVDTGPIGRH